MIKPRVRISLDLYSPYCVHNSSSQTEYSFYDHLFMDLHLSIRLFQPAVKVRGQEERLFLLNGQPVPPASLSFPYCNAHLPLRGLEAHLQSNVSSEYISIPLLIPRR